MALASLRPRVSQMAEDNGFNIALEWFIARPLAERERLVTSCEATSPAISLPEFARKVAAATGLDGDRINALFTGLGGVLAFAADNPSLREFASEYVISLVSGAQDSSDETIKNHIERLLACDRTLGLSGKAQGVMWGQGRVFQRAQTLSQVRPIFPSDLSSEVETAVIVHELRIDYREGNYESAWSVALDRYQVASLIRILDRALQKETSIRKSERFRFLDIEAHDVSENV